MAIIRCRSSAVSRLIFARLQRKQKVSVEKSRTIKHGSFFSHTYFETKPGYALGLIRGSLLTTALDGPRLDALVSRIHSSKTVFADG
jgi:hypothetical protein